MRLTQSNSQDLLVPSPMADLAARVGSPGLWHGLTLIVQLGVLVACSSLSLGAAETGDPPIRHLNNGRIDLLIYLPDAKVGYYRSTRFDWGAMIGQITVGAHTFCAPWREPHDPGHTENAIGPAGEFGIHDPPGYREAKPGESFLKVGVGLLVRDDQPYRFFAGYPFSDAGSWTVSDIRDGLVFTHELAGGGFAYRYEKSVILTTEQPGFTITYRLENCGRRAITTDHYVHHFTSVDHQPVGPGYYIVPPAPPADGIPAGLSWHDGRMRVTGTVQSTQPIAGEIAFGLPASDNHFSIGSAMASLSVVGNFPTTAWEVYALPQALCVEPFMAVDVAPGATMSWSDTYLFK